jgi:hypothetical protein
MIRVVRNPLKEMPPIALPMTRAFLQPRGAKLGERLAGLKIVLNAIMETLRDPRRDPSNDPVQRAREQLASDPEKLEKLEVAIQSEIEAICEAALTEPVP